MSRILRVSFFSILCVQNLRFGPAGQNSRGLNSSTTILIRMGPGYFSKAFCLNESQPILNRSLSDINSS